MIPLGKCLVAAAIALVGVLIAGTDAGAETRLRFSRIVDPVDLAVAGRLLRFEIHLDDYGPARKRQERRAWPDTYEEYLRAFVRIARADLNDDGVDEMFFYIDDSGYCGSIGCPMHVFEKRSDGWVHICGTSASELTEITDWLTEGEGAYREMEARYRIFWWKGSCDFDSPESREYHPPPPGRVPRPMPRTN